MGIDNTGVVLRTRTGKTLLVESRGLEYRQVVAAVQEAASFLDIAAQNADPGDFVSPIQGYPLTCGSVDVLNNRLTVVYRVVGPLLVYVVGTQWCNTFSLLALANAIVRTAVLETKAVDLPQDRLERKFAELYLTIHNMLSEGHTDANGAMEEAHAVIQHVGDKQVPLTRAKAAEAVKTTPAVNYRGTKRTLNQCIQEVAHMTFPTASLLEGLQPRPGFKLPDDDAPQRSAAAAGPRVDPFALSGEDVMSLVGKGGAAGVAKSGIKGADPFADLEALFPVAAAKKDEEAAAAKDKDKDKAGADWAAFDGDEPAKPAAAGGFGDDAFPSAPLPEPKAPVLELRETWRAEVAGGRVTRAGLSGAVHWVGEEARKQVASVQFMLQVPDYASEGLQHALGAAKRSPQATRPGAQQGVVWADSQQQQPQQAAQQAARQAAQPVTAPLLKYHLPAAATCPVPLQVDFGAHWNALPDGRLMVLVALRFVLSPLDRLRCAVLDMEWSLPALLEVPLRVEPAAAKVDGSKRTITWQVPASQLQPGAHGTASAAFLVNADEGAIAPALRRMVATLRASGSKGASLTGVSLAQGVKEVKDTSELVLWTATITAALQV